MLKDQTRNFWKAFLEHVLTTSFPEERIKYFFGFL